MLTFLHHICFVWKNRLSFEAAVLRYRTFSEHAFFCCFRPNPYTRMCVSTIGSYSFFCKIVKTHGKSQVESWIFGFSLIFDLSVYLKNSSRVTFPPSGGGPCSRSSRCSKEQGGRPGGTELTLWVNTNWIGNLI